MRSSFRSFLSVVALVAGIALSEAQAQETRDWITIELEAGNYRLSSYEQNGLYYCMLDFTLGTHPISTKGTTEISGAKRRSDFDFYTEPPWFFNPDFFSASFSL